MQSDPSFEGSFVAMAEKLSPEKLDALSRFKDDHEWDDVTQQFKNRSLVDQFGITRIVAVAVVIIGLTVGIIIAVGPTTNKQSGKGEIATTVEPSVKIQLANGEIIDLSEKKGAINTNSATINNSGEDLT